MKKLVKFSRVFTSFSDNVTCRPFRPNHFQKPHENFHEKRDPPPNCRFGAFEQLAGVLRLRFFLMNMFSSDVASALRKGLFCSLVAVTSFGAIAGELASPTGKNQPKVAAASKEGEEA